MLSLREPLQYLIQESFQSSPCHVSAQWLNIYRKLSVCDGLSIFKLLCLYQVFLWVGRETFGSWVWMYYFCVCVHGVWGSFIVLFLSWFWGIIKCISNSVSWMLFVPDHYSNQHQPLSNAEPSPFDLSPPAIQTPSFWMEPQMVGI